MEGGGGGGGQVKQKDENLIHNVFVHLLVVYMYSS